MAATDETAEEAAAADTAAGIVQHVSALEAALVAAEAERCARPHAVVMPDGKRHECASYQEAWMRRNVEAWKAGLAPLDVSIHDEDGNEVK